MEYDLEIARTVFGKWSIEIIIALSMKGKVGFMDLRRLLGEISDCSLSLKLSQMETTGIVKRDLLSTHPPRVQYYLTPKGHEIVRLGEPVFEYLRRE